MSRPLIVVADPMHRVGFERLEPHFRVKPCEGLSDVERIAAVKEADAIITRSFRMPADILNACPRLKVLSRHGAGVDNVDLAEATRLGIVVANVPGGNAAAVAEATVALMLGAIWRTPEVHNLVVAGQFQRRWELHFEQLTDRSLGLVGLGNIGRRVARICAGGFNMKVLAYDPFLGKEAMAEVGAEKVDDLNTLLRTADVVSLHLPWTPEAHHLIGREQLRLMKPTAVLVNAARGKFVDAAALREALAEGWIAGAGLDVFESEPPDPDDPLLHEPRLVATPHTAGSTVEAEKIVAIASADIVIDAMAGRRPRNIVNPEVWDRRRV